MTAAGEDCWVRPDPRCWPEAVEALTTTRAAPQRVDGLDGWNLAEHVGDRAQAVAGNRRLLQHCTGVTHIQWLTQVHGSRCIEAGFESAGGAPEADAAWTTQTGLGLAVLTADCVPVVVAHRQGRLCAVAHGGWRGLVGGVLESVVGALPADPGDLVAWLGPAIGPTAYEVGDDVVAAVAALPGGAQLTEACVRPGAGGRALLDLFALSERLLARLGVATVASERLCTFTDRRFFSYRRDGRTGRMVTLAWLPETGRS